MDIAEMRKMMATLSKEDGAKQMAEWNEWTKAHAADFSDPGNGVGKNWKVSSAGVVQESNDVGGYSIVQAESAEEAAKIVATGPHLKMPGSACDVMEIISM